jgi:inward rectifier potassium channel
MKPLKLTVPGATYHMKVIGHRPTPLRDLYYGLLKVPWWAAFAIISGLFLLVNALFAVGYRSTGGIANARPDSFADAFFFSVQTLATIGYGAMYPQSRAAHALVVAESILGLTLTALATGLVFAKFSRVRARVTFSHQVAIAPMNGVPTLMFRFGNERGNQIVNAEISAMLIRTERTAEGGTFYRSYDLRLVRNRAFSLSRSWTGLHVIDRDSPLYGQTPESCAEREIEIHILVVGVDDTSMQAIHAIHRYFTPHVIWGAKHADILSESEDGNMVLDLRHFHDTVPTQPTPDFPYP